MPPPDAVGLSALTSGWALYRRGVPRLYNALVNVLQSLPRVSAHRFPEVKPEPTYNKTDIGVLTWDVELQAGETRTFNVSYNVKYPKGRNVQL